MDSYLMKAVQVGLYHLVLIFLLVQTFTIADSTEGIFNIRVTSIDWKAPNSSGYYGENYTYFELEAAIEVWNKQSTTYTYEHSDTCKFKAHVEYIGPFSSFRGENYYPLSCGQAITPVEYQPGLSNGVMYGGVAFDRGNLTSLPVGTYRITTDIVVWNSGDVGYNLGIDFLVSETVTDFLIDEKTAGWGDTTSDGGLELNFEFPVVFLATTVFSYRKITRSRSNKS
jgi:hypothetical protein